MNRVYVDTDDTDNLFCPGDLSHFELVFRSGFKDTIVAHPDIDQFPEANEYVTIGAGKLAAPVRLPPGCVWFAEFGIRKHSTYWTVPIFEDEGTPLPTSLTKGVVISNAAA